MRHVILPCVGLLLFCASTGVAQQPEDKLDTILKEIRALHARMDRLEQQWQRHWQAMQQGRPKKEPAAKLQPPKSPVFVKPVTTVQIPGSLVVPRDLHAPEVPSRRPYSGMLMPTISKDVDEVLTLQFEAPHRLLRGLHEREQRLRQRRFPPDLIGLPR